MILATPMSGDALHFCEWSPDSLSHDLQRQSWEHISREEKVRSTTSPFLPGLVDDAVEKDQESQGPESAGLRKRDSGDRHREKETAAPEVDLGGHPSGRTCDTSREFRRSPADPISVTLTDSVARMADCFCFLLHFLVLLCSGSPLPWVPSSPVSGCQPPCPCPRSQYWMLWVGTGASPSGLPRAPGSPPTGLSWGGEPWEKGPSQIPFSAIPPQGICFVPQLWMLPPSVFWTWGNIKRTAIQHASEWHDTYTIGFILNY